MDTPQNVQQSTSASNQSYVTQPRLPPVEQWFTTNKRKSNSHYHQSTHEKHLQPPITPTATEPPASPSNYHHQQLPEKYHQPPIPEANLYNKISIHHDKPIKLYQFLPASPPNPNLVIHKRQKSKEIYIKIIHNRQEKICKQNPIEQNKICS